MCGFEIARERYSRVSPTFSAAAVTVLTSPRTYASMASRTRGGIFFRRSIGRWSAGLSIGVMSRGMPLLRLGAGLMREERGGFSLHHRRGVEPQDLRSTCALALLFPTNVGRPARIVRSSLPHRSVEPGQAAALAER